LNHVACGPTRLTHIGTAAALTIERRGSGSGRRGAAAVSGRWPVPFVRVPFILPCNPDVEQPAGACVPRHEESEKSSPGARDGGIPASTGTGDAPDSSKNPADCSCNRPLGTGLQDAATDHVVRCPYMEESGRIGPSPQPGTCMAAVPRSGDPFIGGGDLAVRMRAF